MAAVRRFATQARHKLAKLIIQNAPQIPAARGMLQLAPAMASIQRSAGAPSGNAGHFLPRMADVHANAEAPHPTVRREPRRASWSARVQILIGPRR